MPELTGAGQSLPLCAAMLWLKLQLAKSGSEEIKREAEKDRGRRRDDVCRRIRGITVEF